MDIILAGINLDYETIKELKASKPDTEDLTPETISAAYARISRNPLPVNELRNIARKEVEKARKSNRSIVFDMGHSSIAEHAVFNIDVIGVSRLIIEEIEKFRLCSYTEKSQRYIRLEDDFVIPEEIRQSGLEELFVETVKEQNALYQELYSGLRAHIFDKYRDMASNSSHRSTLEGWAKEDARYVISLATEGQLGMTLNARNLELMLRRCAAHPLAEAREYGDKLYATTQTIAPSLVRYTEATQYDRLTRDALVEKSKELILKIDTKDHKGILPETDDTVTLLDVTPDADDKIIASLIHSSSDLPMKECRIIVSRMNRADKEDIIRSACKYMKSYDPPLREFENADLCFEVTISASCFAQLKRHRMATIICQDYDPSLGVTIPPTIHEIGMENRFMDIISQSEETYGRIKNVSPLAANYILTNAHRKRVSIKVNPRELYHISRLREDVHAQWDIRDTAQKMLRLGKQLMPLTLMLATGKDNFDSLYDRCYTDKT